MRGWLILALLVIAFGTFRFVDVLHAALLRCRAPTWQVSCQEQTWERPMMPAPENGALLTAQLACCK